MHRAWTQEVYAGPPGLQQALGGEHVLMDEFVHATALVRFAHLHVLLHSRRDAVQSVIRKRSAKDFVCRKALLIPAALAPQHARQNFRNCGSKRMEWTMSGADLRAVSATGGQLLLCVPIRARR